MPALFVIARFSRPHVQRFVSSVNSLKERREVAFRRLHLAIPCNASGGEGALSSSEDERELGVNKKPMSILITTGVLACGYAVVSSNAFADSTSTPAVVVPRAI